MIVWTLGDRISSETEWAVAAIAGTGILISNVMVSCTGMTIERPHVTRDDDGSLTFRFAEAMGKLCPESSHPTPLNTGMRLNKPWAMRAIPVDSIPA